MNRFDPVTLGRHVRRLRRARAMTLKDVERAAGVSATHVSEVERGKTSPTVGALERIAAAFGVSASRLLEPEGDERVHVALAGRTRAMSIDEGAMSLRPLSSGSPGRAMSLFEVRVAPGREVDPRPGVRLGEEIFVVLEGRLEVRAGADRCTLEPGDSVHLRTGEAIALVSIGDGEARALWITTPRYAL